MGKGRCYDRPLALYVAEEKGLSQPATRSVMQHLMDNEAYESAGGEGANQKTIQVSTKTGLAQKRCLSAH